MNEHPWTLNEYGYWCTCCGFLVAHPDEADTLPDECRQCGFPDAEKLADYMGFDQDNDPEDDPEDWFDCGMLADGTCMKAGSEECDWDCPRGAVARHCKRKSA
jgi:ribosomal protein L37E